MVPVPVRFMRLPLFSRGLTDYKIRHPREEVTTLLMLLMVLPVATAGRLNCPRIWPANDGRSTTGKV